MRQLTLLFLIVYLKISSLAFPELKRQQETSLLTLIQHQPTIFVNTSCSKICLKFNSQAIVYLSSSEQQEKINSSFVPRIGCFEVFHAPIEIVLVNPNILHIDYQNCCESIISCEKGSSSSWHDTCASKLLCEVLGILIIVIILFLIVYIITFVKRKYTKGRNQPTRNDSTGVTEFYSINPCINEDDKVLNDILIWSQSISDEDDSDEKVNDPDICPICLHYQQKWKTSCGHYLCSKCLKQCIEYNGRCPFDRLLINTTPEKKNCLAVSTIVIN